MSPSAGARPQNLRKPPALFQLPPSRWMRLEGNLAQRSKSCRTEDSGNWSGRQVNSEDDRCSDNVREWVWYEHVCIYVYMRVCLCVCAHISADLFATLLITPPNQDKTPAGESALQRANFLSAGWKSRFYLLSGVLSPSPYIRGLNVFQSAQSSATGPL